MQTSLSQVNHLLQKEQMEDKKTRALLGPNYKIEPS